MRNSLLSLSFLIVVCGKGHLKANAYGAYGVVISMFDFHCSDRGSNSGRGGKIS